MQSLADRFYDLVCLKLNHHNKNKVKRNPNPRLESEDLFDSEEAKRSGYRLQNDVPVPQNVAEDRQDNFVYHPAPGTSSAPSEDIRPLSIDQESTQPIAVSPAPYLNDHNPMGDTSSKLIAGELEFPNIKLKRHMVKQQERANQTNSHQLDTNSAGLELFQTRMESASDSQSPPRFIGQNGRSPIPTTHNTKRLLPDGTRSRIVKRSKKDSDVQIVKPSLIVVLKLTRGKGVSNRQITVPPPQPYVPMPLVEDGEISVRHPSVPASQRDAAVTGPDIEDERTSVQPVEPMNDISEVAMDNPHDLNDLTSATDPTDATRPLSTMPGRPHVTQTQRESQVIAEFYRLWSGEASELVRAMLTTSPSKHTPGNLLFDILLPVLRDTHEHCQKGRTELQQSIEPFDTASQGQPTRDLSSLNNTGGIHASSSELGGENFNVPVQPTRSQHCSVVATLTLGGGGEAAKDDVHVDEQPRKSSPALTAPKAIPEEITASEVVRDAFQDSAFDYKRLVRNIDLKIFLDRNDGLEPKKLAITGIGGIMDSNEFFKSIEYEYGWVHTSSEEFSTARVTEADGSSSKWPRTDLSLRCASRRDRSWIRWLSELRVCFEREGVDIKMDLVAVVQVTRKSDAKV